MSARTLKLIGAAGAAALTVGVMTTPALAAGEYTATATYTCFSGAIHPPASFVVDTPSTTHLIAGQKVNANATNTVTLGPAATGLMIQQGWDHFTGSITAPSPSKTLGAAMTVPSTAVGTAGGNTVATATGKVVLDYPAAGTYTLQTGDFTATLKGFAAGNPVGNPLAVDCVAPTDGTTVLKDSLSNPLSIVVAKDKSKTTTKAKYNAKKDVATGSVTVAGSKFKLAGTGKVKFTLKKGSKTVKSITAKLKKGKASADFKKVSAKGSYSISASFAGDAGLKGSSGKATFKVK